MTGSWDKKKSALFVLFVMGAVAALGWEAPPWSGQVRVYRSEIHRAKIPYTEGMRVRDALAQSRSLLGNAPGTVVLYRWRSWLPERILDGAVVGMQGALHAMGFSHWSERLWTCWDTWVPRQKCWREVARGGAASDLLLNPGELIVLIKEESAAPEEKPLGIAP